jgi:CDP-glucose 4,6-dehydratase
MSGPAIDRSPTLVTGGQGFIGAWLAERLAAGGAHVVVPVRGVDPAARFWAEGIAERCTVVRADLGDRDGLVRLLDEHGIEVVFHLAAQPIVGVANRSPYGTWESNVRGSYSLLDACRVVRARGAGPRRIVIASSDHCYGDHDELPFREDFGFNAAFPYDVSKACTDLIAQSYARSLGLPIAVMRLANVYGGGDLNWSRIVPDTARSLALGRTPVIRSDGSPERDYVYVEDAVDAYLTLAASLDDERFWGRAWNAGHGRGVPVVELVRRLIAASGRDAEPDVRGRAVPVAEIQRQYLDASAIRAELGWEPRWDLDRGLGATYRWYEAVLRTPAVAT